MYQVFRIVLIAGVLLGADSLKGQSPSEKLSERTTLEFAPVEVGRKMLSTRDDFVQRMQPLERQVRLQSEQPVSEQKYLDFLADGVISWKDSEVESVSAAIRYVRGRVKQWDLPWPESIQLIRVDKKVESNAPHCRGASIIIPDSFIGSESRMATVLLHELFHVLSSHNPDLRDKLYAIIGYERCNEVKLPDTLIGRRLTNPDAPVWEHRIQIEHEGKQLNLLPITITRSAEYDGRGLFQSMDFKLMVIQEQDGKWQPDLQEGRPTLLGPREVPDFHRQIGGNTGYIIHPEETLADNFWMMAMERPDIPDPWVIEKMRGVLDELSE